MRRENENVSQYDTQEMGAGLPPPKPEQTFCAIEEHAWVLRTPAPVFAAVCQYKGWTAGKKVDKSEFERAVKAFLGAPAKGGNNAA